MQWIPATDQEKSQGGIVRYGYGKSESTLLCSSILVSFLETFLSLSL